MICDQTLHTKTNVIDFIKLNFIYHDFNFINDNDVKIYNDGNNIEYRIIASTYIEDKQYLLYLVNNIEENYSFLHMNQINEFKPPGLIFMFNLFDKVNLSAKLNEIEIKFSDALYNNDYSFCINNKKVYIEFKLQGNIRIQEMIYFDLDFDCIICISMYDGLYVYFIYEYLFITKYIKDEEYIFFLFNKSALIDITQIYPVDDNCTLLISNLKNYLASDDKKYVCSEINPGMSLRKLMLDYFDEKSNNENANDLNPEISTKGGSDTESNNERQKTFSSTFKSNDDKKEINSTLSTECELKIKSNNENANDLNPEISTKGGSDTESNNERQKTFSSTFKSDNPIFLKLYDNNDNTYKTNTNRYYVVFFLFILISLFFILI